MAATIIGQATLLGRLDRRPLPTAAFVLLDEEPMLLRRYGSDYVAYRRAVPGLWAALAYLGAR